MTAEEWFWRGDVYYSGAVALTNYQRQTNDMLVLSEVTCTAFSAECYFKCLLTIRQRHFRRGEHDLLTLYKLLSPGDRRWIQTYFDEHHLEQLLLDGAKVPKEITPPRTLLQLLKLNGNAIVDSRYRAKWQGTWFIARVPSCVKAGILEVRPEWVASPPKRFCGPYA